VNGIRQQAKKTNAKN